MKSIKAFGREFVYEKQKSSRITNPKTAIVMPVYNSGQILTRAVISALTQSTEYPYEINIVDDGSQTSVRETLDSAVTNDPKISLFRQQNKGISDAMNLGTLVSKSEFIILLDSDDELLPDAVQKITEQFLSNPKTVYVYTDGYWVGKLQGWTWEKNHPLDINSYVTPWIKKEFSRELLLKEMYLGHARAYRKETFMQVNGFDPRFSCVAEDWDFALKVSEIGEIKKIPEKLHKYYLQEKGITKSTSKKLAEKIKEQILCEAKARKKNV